MSEISQRCPRCGADVHPEAIFCPRCGARAPAHPERRPPLGAGRIIGAVLLALVSAAMGFAALSVGAVGGCAIILNRGLPTPTDLNPALLLGIAVLCAAAAAAGFYGVLRLLRG